MAFAIGDPEEFAADALRSDGRDSDAGDVRSCLIVDLNVDLRGEGPRRTGLDLRVRGESRQEDKQSAGPCCQPGAGLA